MIKICLSPNAPENVDLRNDIFHTVKFYHSRYRIHISVQVKRNEYYETQTIDVIKL